MRNAPQVVPALDPSTPIFAAGFSMQLIKRRMQEFNIWAEERFHTFTMRTPFDAGPFRCHTACAARLPWLVQRV